MGTTGREYVHTLLYMLQVPKLLSQSTCMMYIHMYILPEFMVSVTEQVTSKMRTPHYLIRTLHIYSPDGVQVCEI